MGNLSKHFDSKAREEYLDRIMWENPELSLDEAYDAAAGGREQVDMTFGSSGYTVSIANVLSGESRSIFINGYCGLLAHIISAELETDRFLLVTATEGNRHYSEHGWSGHVLAESTRDGLWIDFDGEHTEDGVKERYSASDYSAEIVDREQFLKTVISEQHREDPLGFIDGLEQAFSRAVAEAVLARVERAYN